MAKYNRRTSVRSEKTVSHEGGAGYKLTPEFELINILANGISGKFYESENIQSKRLKSAIDKTVASKGEEFVAKALVYARTKMGQRSVTHLGASLLAPYLSGTPIGKHVFSKFNRRDEMGGVIYRLDDMLEIIACYQHLNPGKGIPNSMKKGFKRALENADAYEIAKYQASSRSVSLVDVANLVHPNPPKEKEEVFKALMEGTLSQFDTAEDKQSSSGRQVAEKVKSGEITKEEAKEELAEAKKENWRELIESKKIGYMALLRNLRNILKQADSEILDQAIALLTDQEFIVRSKVWPHQIDIALEVIMDEFSNTETRKLVPALNKAYELSIPNLTEHFPGRTAVVIDTSGSMFGVGWGGNLKINGKAVDKAPIEKAALIGATFGKAVGADIYQFASHAAEVNYNPIDSINTIKNKVLAEQGSVGHGTMLETFFNLAQSLGRMYNRVFIISDMQTADYAARAINNYSANPYTYNIHLCGYQSTILPKSNSRNFKLFGYGSDIYELAKKVEINPNELIKEIEAIRLR